MLHIVLLDSPTERRCWCLPSGCTLLQRGCLESEQQALVMMVGVWPSKWLCRITRMQISLASIAAQSFNTA